MNITQKKYLKKTAEMPLNRIINASPFLAVRVPSGHVMASSFPCLTQPQYTSKTLYAIYD